MGDTVYRVQDKDGRGPWKPGFSHKWVEGRSDHKNLRPWHEEFGIGWLSVLLIGEHSGIGCKTLKQLRRWFTKNEYRKLKKYGYFAVKIEVDRILVQSDIQCLFGRVKPLNVDVETVEMYE